VQSSGLSAANQAQAMVQKLLEQGYTLGAAAAQKAKDFDEKHQFTRTASAKAGEFRESAAAAGKEKGLWRREDGYSVAPTS